MATAAYCTVTAFYTFYYLLFLRIKKKLRGKEGTGPITGLLTTIVLYYLGNIRKSLV